MFPKTPVVGEDNLARLLKTSGRHAQRFHDQEVQDPKPQAIQFDQQGSVAAQGGSFDVDSMDVKAYIAGLMKMSES